MQAFTNIKSLSVSHDNNSKSVVILFSGVSDIRYVSNAECDHVTFVVVRSLRVYMWGWWRSKHSGTLPTPATLACTRCRAICKTNKPRQYNDKHIYLSNNVMWIHKQRKYYHKQIERLDLVLTTWLKEKTFQQHTIFIRLLDVNTYKLV